MNNFGLPYLGSKNSIAIDILRFLPAGKRFCDLCGGGGAITHAALTSYKWDSVLYNEISPLVVKAFRMAIHGEFRDEKRWISREDFMRLKAADPYVAFCFSFGNNLTTYSYSAAMELWTRALHLARVNNDFSLFHEWGIDTDGTNKDIWKHRDEYMEKFGKHIGQTVNIKEPNRIHHFQALDRIRNLDYLFSLEYKLTITCDSYLNYRYIAGDTVYLDIPYPNTDCKYYNGFDFETFYNWAKTRPYQIFFSGYPDDNLPFYRVWETKKQLFLGDIHTSRVECLYSNFPVEKKSLLPIQLTLF